MGRSSFRLDLQDTLEEEAQPASSRKTGFPWEEAERPC